MGEEKEIWLFYICVKNKFLNTYLRKNLDKKLIHSYYGKIIVDCQSSNNNNLFKDLRFEGKKILEVKNERKGEKIHVLGGKEWMKRNCSGSFINVKKRYKRILSSYTFKRT